MEEDKSISSETEIPEEEKPVKSNWQRTKESWYDKIPVSLKQMDIIVAVCWTLLILTGICIALEAMGIIRLFG